MNITIWVIKNDLLKFAVMYKYASEFTGGESDKDRIKAIKAHYVPYYDHVNQLVAKEHQIETDLPAWVKELHTVQLTIPIEVYLNLELAKIS